jgi:hypothetical protein
MNCWKCGALVSDPTIRGEAHLINTCPACADAVFLPHRPVQPWCDYPMREHTVDEVERLTPAKLERSYPISWREMNVNSFRARHVARRNETEE